MEAVISFWAHDEARPDRRTDSRGLSVVRRRACERQMLGRVIDPEEFERVLSREGHRPRQCGPHYWELELSEWGYAKSALEA